MFFCGDIKQDFPPRAQENGQASLWHLHRPGLGGAKEPSAKKEELFKPLISTSLEIF